MRFLLLFLVFLVSACSKPTPQEICKNIGKETIDMSVTTGANDPSSQIMTLENEQEVLNLKPSRINLPGQIVQSCKADAYMKNGSKIKISYFKSKSGEDFFVAYEELLEESPAEASSPTTPTTVEVPVPVAVPASAASEEEIATQDASVRESSAPESAPQALPAR